MSSLLKAYLMGSDDPFILAKAYYDDLVENDNLILKDAQAVQSKIIEELGFDLNDHIKTWTSELEDVKEEIEFWSEINEAVKVKRELWPLFEGIMQEPTAERIQEPIVSEPSEGAPKTYIFEGEVESIPITQISGYLKELKDMYIEAEYQIGMAWEEYDELIQQITGMKPEEWEDPKGWSEETYVKIHSMGLDYIEDKLNYYKEMFQLAKDNKEIPQIEPEMFAVLRRELQTLYDKWDEMVESPDKKRPTRPQQLDEKNKIINKFAAALKNADSPEAKWKYYQNNIKQWEVRKKNSEKQLEKYLGKKEHVKSLQELKKLGKKQGLKYNAEKELWWKFKSGKGPEHSRGKNWYSYNSETKKFERVIEPKKIQTKRESGNLTFASEEWWEILADTSTISGEIDGKKIGRKGFKQAFKNFLKRAPSLFNKRPKEGKTG